MARSSHPSKQRLPWTCIYALRGAAVFFLALLVLAVWLFGPANEPEIVSYTVEAVSTGRGPQQSADPIQGAKMLGAIVPVETQAWVLKLTGPDRLVAEQRDAFLAFVKSLDFGDPEAPTWTVPGGWKELPDDAPQNRGMIKRFATLTIPAGGSDVEPLEVSVTKLPLPPSGYQDYLLANVNRWRGQLQLPEISRDELDSSTEQIAVQDRVATLVELDGQGSSPGSPHPPFMSRPARATRPSNSDPEFTVPEGWQKSAGSAISRFAYEVKDDDKRVEITVTAMRSSGLLPNVNRWRGQVDLEPIKQEELDKQVEKIKLGGVTGDYVEMQGPQETILAVVANQNDQAWFIRLRGDSELAVKERQRFKEFAESFKF